MSRKNGLRSPNTTGPKHALGDPSPTGPKAPRASRTSRTSRASLRPKVGMCKCGKVATYEVCYWGSPDRKIYVCDVHIITGDFFSSLEAIITPIYKDT